MKTLFNTLFFIMTFVMMGIVEDSSKMYFIPALFIYIFIVACCCKFNFFASLKNTSKKNL